MADIKLFKQDASEAGTAKLADAVFAGEVNKSLLHDSVNSFLANKRQGTRATKTRGLVSGGGKKPWKQKGTGRARQGSIRATQWKGGGTVHGPQPRDFSIELPKKVRRAALRSALSAKAKEGQLVILESFDLSTPKTKAFSQFLKGFKVEGAKVAFITETLTPAVKLSARNLPNVTYSTSNSVHPYQLLWADKVFITKGAIAKLEEALS